MNTVNRCWFCPAILGFESQPSMSVVLCGQPWLVPIWNHHQSVLPCYPHGTKSYDFPKKVEPQQLVFFSSCFRNPQWFVVNVQGLRFHRFFQKPIGLPGNPSVWGWKSPGFVVRYLLTFNQTCLEIPPVSSIYFFQLSTSIQFTSRFFRSHVWLPEGQSLRASNGLEHHTQCKHIFRKNQKDLIFRLPFPNLQSIRFGVLQIFFNSYFLWARLTLLPAQALRVEKISEAVLKVSGVVAMYLRTPQESHQISDDVPSGKHTKSYGSYVP